MCKEAGKPYIQILNTCLSDKMQMMDQTQFGTNAIPAKTVIGMWTKAILNKKKNPSQKLDVLFHTGISDI